MDNNLWLKKAISYSLSQFCKLTGLCWVVLLWSLSCGCNQMTARAVVIGSPRWAVQDGLFTVMPGTWHWPLTENSSEVSTRAPTQVIFMWLGLLMGKWSRVVTFLTCWLASKREHPKVSAPRNLGGSYKFSCDLTPRSCSISSLVFYWSKASDTDSPDSRGRDCYCKVHLGTNYHSDTQK